MKNTIFFERRTIRLAAAATVVLLTIAVSKGFAGPPYIVANFNDSGTGSLRQAILDANGHVNNGNIPDEIHLQTSPATGTINLLSPLPAITDAVRVINDGTGSGRIELNGYGTRNQAQLSIGFDFQAPNCATASPSCEVWGFTINRFGEAGIRV